MVLLQLQAGIKDYNRYIQEVCEINKDKPVSFEVLGDDLETIKRQGYQIGTSFPNVYVKVPIVNSVGFCNGEAIKYLVDNNIKVNITAVMTTRQIDRSAAFLKPNIPGVISVFAGRIADTGRDPKPFIRHAVEVAHDWSDVWEVLWASPREAYNIYEAEQEGVDIITLTPSLWDKLSLKDKDLEEFSKETSKMFFDDAKSSGLVI